MRAWSKGDEKLTAIGAFPSVGHAYQSFLVNLSPSDVFIFKIPSIDACPACTISSGNISALDHELVNDPMKRRQFVRQRLGDAGLSERSSTYCPKVLACLGSSVIKQLNANPSKKVGTALNVEENSRT